MPLTTWNSFGIANVLDGPPTLAGTDLTFTELDGTQTVIVLPAGGGVTDRYVTNITTTLDSANPRRFTIQLTRNDGLPTLTTTHTVPHETPADGAAGYLLGKATAADRDFRVYRSEHADYRRDDFPLRQRHYRAGHGDNHHP